MITQNNENGDNVQGGQVKQDQNVNVYLEDYYKAIAGFRGNSNEKLTFIQVISSWFSGVFISISLSIIVISISLYFYEYSILFDWQANLYEKTTLGYDEYFYNIPIHWSSFIAVTIVSGIVIGGGISILVTYILFFILYAIPRILDYPSSFNNILSDSALRGCLSAIPDWANAIGTFGFYVRDNFFNSDKDVSSSRKRRTRWYRIYTLGIAFIEDEKNSIWRSLKKGIYLGFLLVYSILIIVSFLFLVISGILLELLLNGLLIISYAIRMINLLLVFLLARIHFALMLISLIWVSVHLYFCYLCGDYSSIYVTSIPFILWIIIYFWEEHGKYVASQIID